MPNPNRVWIINGANGDLTPGRFRARLVRGGPYVPVEVIETIPRDGEGNVCGDATYIVKVNGRVVADYLREFPQGMFGEPDETPAPAREDATEKVDLIKAPLPF
jgi:hypothetical protein